MKALICIVLFFACAVAHTYIRKIGGMIGAVLTVAVAAACIAIGKWLCEKWDEHKRKKKNGE